MAKHLKDTEYLTVSSYLRAKESKMLDGAGYDRLLAAPGFDEAVHILSEYGYPEFSGRTMTAVNDMLNGYRQTSYEDIFSDQAAKPIAVIFARKFDYHNLKVLVKAHTLGTDPSPLLADGGTVPAEAVAELWQSDALEAPLQKAADATAALMASSGDPQLVDIALDKAYFAELLTIAGGLKNDFISGYVQALIDSANLRTAVRCLRMGRSGAFLAEALIDGGTADTRRIVADPTPGTVRDAFEGSAFTGAAALAEKAVETGSMTALERACDDAVAEFLSGANVIGCGAEVVLAHLVLLENEITGVRMILSGKLSGIAPEQIRERLRADHV